MRPSVAKQSNVCCCQFEVSNYPVNVIRLRTFKGMNESSQSNKSHAKHKEIKNIPKKVTF